MWSSIDLDTFPIGQSASRSPRTAASPDSPVEPRVPSQGSQVTDCNDVGSQLDAAFSILLNEDGRRDSDGDADAWLPVPAIDYFDIDWSAVAMQNDWVSTGPEAAGRIAPPASEPGALNVANSVQESLTSTSVAAEEPSAAAKGTQPAFSLSPSSKSPSTSPGSFAVPHPRPLSRGAVSSTPATSLAHNQVPPSSAQPSPSTSSSPTHRSPPSSNPSPFLAPAFPLQTPSVLRHSSSAPALASADFDPTAILASLDIISSTSSSVDHASVHSTPRTTPPSSTSLTSLTSPGTLPPLPFHLRRPSAVSIPLEPPPNEEDESSEAGSSYDEEEEAEPDQQEQQQQPEQQPGEQGEAKPKEKRRRRKRPNMFKCQLDPNCKAEFSRAEHLARHERKHTKEKPFICHCTKAFSRLDNWRQHKNSVHKDETIENQRTEDRLMGVHKTIQRRNNANKQAYMSGETLAISAPPESIPGSSTGGGVDAVAPLPAPMHQPTFAGVHQHQPQLSIATSGPDFDSPYGSPSRYYHNRSSSGAYGYWPGSGEETSHYSAGSAPGDSPTYGLAETSGRAYVALSPTATSFAQSSSGVPAPSPYGGYGPVLSMPPAAFSPGTAGSYTSPIYQSQAPPRPQPPSQRSSANSSARSGHSTVDGHGNNTSPSPSGSRAIQLPSLSSSVSSGGSPEAELARQEILRARALAAVLNKPIEEIEREAAFFPGSGNDYETSRPPSATQLSHSLAALTSHDPLTTGAAGEYGGSARVSPPSPLRPLNDPAVTIGLPAQPQYISAPGTPGDRYGSFHRPAAHHAYPPFATPPLSGPDTTSYRLPARPKSSNDMRSAVVLASAVAAHHAAVGGDTFNPIDMAHSASSSSTLASSPSYSFNPHPHPFASPGVHPAGGMVGGGPSSSVPASPVVSYLMPPFFHHAGAPRHLESPNLPSTPRMESASSVTTRGSVMPASRSPLLGGPVSGGAGSAAGMMMGPGSAASTPVMESSGVMGPNVERAGSPGKRRREDEVELPRMAVTKRVAY